MAYVLLTENEVFLSESAFSPHRQKEGKKEDRGGERLRTENSIVSCVRL